MSVKSVSLNDVVVGDVPTHIVIYRDSTTVSLMKKVDDLTEQLERMSKRVLHMELAAEAAKAIEETKTTPFFAASVAPEPTGLHVRRMSDIGAEVKDDSKSTFKAIIHGLVPPPNATNIKMVKISPEIEEQEEQEEQEQEAEEAEEAEAEEQEEAEAEALQEFEYKGNTYYRDSENLVYKLDDDGDLDDTPFGVWNEEKQKILKYKV